MSTLKIDATGLRCPQPVLKMTMKLPEMQKGDVLEVRGDCPTFESDVRKWCDRMKKTLLAIEQDGTVKVVRVQI